MFIVGRNSMPHMGFGRKHKSLSIVLDCFSNKEQCLFNDGWFIDQWITGTGEPEVGTSTFAFILNGGGLTCQYPFFVKFL
jgi:hypothetical protein